MHMATLSYVTIKHGPSAACVGQAFRRHKKLEEAQVSSDLNFLKDLQSSKHAAEVHLQHPYS